LPSHSVVERYFKDVWPDSPNVFHNDRSIARNVRLNPKSVDARAPSPANGRGGLGVREVRC
jgi:hypothetical protein